MAQTATLPKAVRNQIKRANKLAKEAGLENAPDDEEEEEAAPEKEVKPNGKAEEGAEPEKENEPAAKEPADKQIQEPKPETTVDWEAKYKVLQGKYDAEVPRLSQRVRELSHDLQNTQNVLASVGSKEKKQEEPKKGPKFLTSEEVEDYGPEFIDVVRRVAKEEYEDTISQLRDENKRLRQQLGSVSQFVENSQEDVVYATLDREVKDWQTLNNDEGFLAWLREIDPYVGIARGELLRRAYERKDAPRVVAFFKGYLNENAVVEPTSEGKAPTRPETVVGDKLDLETLAAPGKPKSGGTTGAPKEKRIWTSPEIRKFYDDVQRGVYRDNEKERRRIEQDIFRAQSEDRIR